MFRELMHMDKLEAAKVILKDALLSQKKTDEVFAFLKTVISYEDEMIKLKADFAEDKFQDMGKYEHDKFVNYDEIVLDRIKVENREDFA